MLNGLRVAAEIMLLVKPDNHKSCVVATVIDDSMRKATVKLSESISIMA